MRGNWDTLEPLVLAPGQQHQQQAPQHTIVEEQRHPLHSTTTPAWGGIADRIKEEPSEDKNNDSGVSPGHYTSNSASPRSRRSSSTANCSLSPGSATSQDSNTMQCTTFEYSPQRLFKTCGSPLEYTRITSMDESPHQQDQTMDVVSSSMKPASEDGEVGQDTFQCPVCSFATLNRHQFSEHLTAHCATKCTTPDFAKSVLNQMTTQSEENSGSSPTQGDRSEHESEEADEPGLRVPRINSQGKVKTFRCKQCNFVAITKLEFWEHSRGHIKAEKLLTCPKCPFVTEYKHHLEYHLRNHFGSKPFKCDKCSYSCVNKSMLNSHLKSHSNVYQYRCANCSYATKYCHSLKLHLRKYSHKPAMVLNADGSPNPLPIIDIYGTRRGPKQKPIKTQEDTGVTNAVPNSLQSPLGTNQLVVPPQVSPVSRHPTGPMNPMIQINGMSHIQSGLVPSFPYNQLFGSFALPNQFALPEENGEKQLEHLKSTVLLEYAKALSAERFSDDCQQDCQKTSPVDLELADGPVTHDVKNSVKDTATSTTIEPDVEPETRTTPLDLSKPEPPISQMITTNSPRASGTSRRKGRAIKLDRRVVEDESDEEHEEDMENPLESPLASSPAVQVADDRSFISVGMSNEFTCQYCEIAFGNLVMYTVHMGYHGYKNPYTCNMCGHQCTDKVSFFLHIARSKHS
ncbi:protein hunchback isoform X2 [Cephus cinctus]|uniref:Protein hunchback n=1 Tax=Cephus cinctus TaxID=211228 RepID=A0AAJ7FJN3_CEPCN|nr:protein hunchback isoform X2 [Cephus cinctus]